MTLASFTALASKILRDRPDLQGDRKIDLFLDACIEELRKLPVERPPIAPVDRSEI